MAIQNASLAPVVSRLLGFFFYIIITCINLSVYTCVLACTCHMCEGQGILVGVTSLLLPPGSQSSKLGHQACQQVPLSAEPSC